MSYLTVSLRPLVVKSDDSCQVKSFSKEALHLEDLIRTIEGPKNTAWQPVSSSDKILSGEYTVRITGHQCG